MERTGYLLAEIPGFGRVFDCGACGNLHVNVGPVSLTLATDAYMQLVTLLNTSAANFELWMRANRTESCAVEQEWEQEWDRGHVEGEAL